MGTLDYTVEAKALPVLNDDWDPLYRVLDTYPGTILIEDPIEPSLIFAVATENDLYAHAFVVCVMDLAELRYTSICVSHADRLDFDYDPDDYDEVEYAKSY